MSVMEEQEKTLSTAELQDGKIVLEDFPGASDNGMRIEGRIKYVGFESWSPWISTQNPVRYFDIVLKVGRTLRKRLGSNKYMHRLLKT